MNASIIAAMAIHYLLRQDALTVTRVGENIYSGAIPENGTYPSIIINPYRVKYIQAEGQTTWLAADVRMIVKAVTNQEDTIMRAAIIDDSSFQALKDKETTITFENKSYFVRVAKRENDINYIENEGKYRYNHVGGIYWLVINS